MLPDHCRTHARTQQVTVYIWLPCPSVCRSLEIRGPVRPSIEVMKPKSGLVCPSLFCSRSFSALIPGVFFFPPFSGGLPRVNTRFFFFFSRPFPTGCPRLIPRVFFSHPFLAGCPRLIPGFFCLKLLLYNF